MNIKVVIGANYGDEGKGLLSNHFAKEAYLHNKSCITVMSNGGAQRGHTAFTKNDDRFVYHHFCSGTGYHSKTFFPSQFIVNPLIFNKEFDELCKIRFPPKTIMHCDCLVTTPYDMMLNQIIEQHRGNARHGSVGVGIFETIVRNKKYKFTVKDIIDNNYDSLLDIREFYVRDRLEEFNTFIPDEWHDLIFSDTIFENFIDDCKLMLSTTKVVTSYDELNKYDTVIFENGQGLLLSQTDENTDEPYKTPSFTGLYEPSKIIKQLDNKEDVEVVYVTRTYLTRHGAGPLPDECKKEHINCIMKDLTNVPNEFQGTLRYAKLDYDKLISRIQDDFIKYMGNDYKPSIAITHLDDYNGYWLFTMDYFTRNHIFKNLYTADNPKKVILKSYYF